MFHWIRKCWKNYDYKSISRRSVVIQFGVKLFKQFTEDISTVHSTVGFSRAEFEVNGYKLIAYDLGGNERIRDIWSNYYSEVSFSSEKNIFNGVQFV